MHRHAQPLLSFQHFIQLSFLEIGNHPLMLAVYNAEKRLACLYQTDQPERSPLKPTRLQGGDHGIR